MKQATRVAHCGTNPIAAFQTDSCISEKRGDRDLRKRPSGVPPSSLRPQRAFGKSVMSGTSAARPPGGTAELAAGVAGVPPRPATLQGPPPSSTGRGLRSADEEPMRLTATGAGCGAALAEFGCAGAGVTADGATTGGVVADGPVVEGVALFALGNVDVETPG